MSLSLRALDGQSPLIGALSAQQIEYKRLRANTHHALETDRLFLLPQKDPSCTAIYVPLHL
ncbi:hypothetical protein N7447_007003 [Penicillium robsamsonii]|uniref:uncharacterized protein n=1 Tax=Penicillium robsamsonii TaxID=1792511 RepID=UPI002546DCF1|nr:uncharacterized protein N7447_007003 [Penicillium robsamsonii]KAJ5824663.1 hypothetical protein N7447_007003 [Penicillium robsamsonii]